MTADEAEQRLQSYLKSWYNTSTAKQRAAGKTVNLSLDDFRSLFLPRQLDSLRSAIRANRLRYFQSADNPFALVLSWKSYTACQSDVFDKTTACVCARRISKSRNRIQEGEKLSERTKQRISDGKRGKPIKQEHKDALSAALLGKPKKPWTEERKALRRAQIAAKKEKNDD